MIKLSVPAMFDDDYLEKLHELNLNSSNNSYISEVYGSFPGAPVGTIRPSKTLPEISLEKVKNYIKLCNKYNITFNYIMNSTVLDGSEYSKEERKKILDFIDELVEYGLKRITITIPFLIKLVKRYFPNLHITASICAEVDSVKRALDFEELGVDCIVLAKDVNRDFNLIEQINKNFSGEIKLLATTPCIFKCSDLFYHMNLSSIRDNDLQYSFKVKGDFISHTAVRCQRRRLEHLEEYIKSPWIRPEDMRFYSNIGVNNFKIDGRDKSIEYNLDVITAYMNNKFDGNLLYLMQNYYPKNSSEMSMLSNSDSDFWRLAVFINNRLLDGFLEKFYTKKLNCNNGCKNCNYCNLWSEKVICIDKDNTDKYLELLKSEDEERLSI